MFVHQIPLAWPWRIRPELLLCQTMRVHHVSLRLARFGKKKREQKSEKKRGKYKYIHIYTYIYEEET